MQDEEKLSQSERDLRDRAVEEATNGDGPKASKFLTGEKNPETIKKRKAAAKNRQILDLQIQLATQEDYTACWTLLSKAQSALDIALIENADEIERLQDNAAKLADGTLVFYDPENGKWYTADDKCLPADQSPTDISNNPSKRQDYQSAIRRRFELATIQDEVLNPSREALQEGKLTDTEMKIIEGQLNEALAVIEGKEAPVELENEPELQAQIASIEKNVPVPVT